MSLYAPATYQTNVTVTARSGTTLTAGATPHTEAASWTSLIASTNAQSEGFWLRVVSVAVNATDTGMLIDVAYGDVGGGNEVAVLTDYSVGGASDNGSIATNGDVIFVPTRIPSTKSVSARIRSTVASDTCIVAIWLRQSVQALENVGVATVYGADTATSRGTLVAMGNGADGAWVEIGTTSASHNLLVPSVDPGGDTTLQTTDITLQLGYGGTVSPATTISALFVFNSGGGNEGIAGPVPSEPIYAVVASGSKLWARLTGSSTDSRGVSIHGMSGTAPSSGGGFRNFYPGQS